MFYYLQIYTYFIDVILSYIKGTLYAIIKTTDTALY